MQPLKPYLRPVIRRIRQARDRSPLLTVVVPFHESALTLAASVESLLGQTYERLEILLVDDGADEPSCEVARRLAATDRRIRIVQQAHQGVGAARNTGARAALGVFLAFCDADDTVPAQGYERMVRSLVESGSDLVIGALTLQERGRHQQPGWLARSNPRRRQGLTLGVAPEVVANHYVGPRVFRQSFWIEQSLVFDTTSDYSDIVTMVRALVAASSFDVLPAVVYHWNWRTDGRSLVQRALRDPARVVDRVARVSDAGEVLVSSASGDVQSAFFAGVLHTTIADLVRAAVARDADYWSALSSEVKRLTDMIPPPTWRRVPVEDRIIAWLCSRDHRGATEEFLEYAFDNPTGFPHELVGDVPHVTLPVIDELEDAFEDVTAVAEDDLRYRTRLVSLRWTTPQVLELTGIAFVEYLSARVEGVNTHVLLVDRSTSREIRLKTEPAPEVNANLWATRAHEDHTRDAFRVEIDVTQLPAPVGSRERFDILVEHTVEGRSWRSSFHTRQVDGSAGLLEPSSFGELTATPAWAKFVGLSLLVRQGARDGRDRPVPPVSVHALSTEPGHLVLTGRTDRPGRDVEVALHGPRCRTAWVRGEQAGDDFVARISLMQDDWGLGVAQLPADRYQVVFRTADTPIGEVACDAPLRRRLPWRVQECDLHLIPDVNLSGELQVRIVPAEQYTDAPAYDRRRLRDELYPAAREQPLLDVVVFETFAGKAGGDNPGAICRELGRRAEDLELVYSVIDRSVIVPAGARKVVRFTREYFELLGRARYLVVNASLPYFFRKREGQLYFQTWHGTPLKRIAHDRVHLDFFNWHHRRQLLVARDGWDYLLSQSEFCGRSLSSAFRYSGPLMELGYPRNDVMLAPEREEIRARVRRGLGIAEGAQVVLYAPTWRDNMRVGRVFEKVLYLEPEKMVRDLEDCVVLVRGHYNSVKAAEEVDPDRRIIDVTRYPDIADLYVAADALVTDYSSVFFDFVLVDKPMVFLAPDLHAYRDDNRGFYLDYHDTVPGPICQTTEEVVAALGGPDTFAGRRKEFRRTFAPHDDGHASARVVDAILKAHPYR